MELRFLVNIVPLVSIVALLWSLKSDPGWLLFGEETYPGELRWWGVLFRCFCLAAFFRFRALWPALVYFGVYWAFGAQLGRFVELVAFALFALMLTDYRDVLFKIISLRSTTPTVTSSFPGLFARALPAPPSISTPKTSSGWTPFSGLRAPREARAASSSRAGGNKVMRSKSPHHRAAGRTPVVAEGTPLVEHPDFQRALDAESTEETRSETGEEDEEQVEATPARAARRGTSTPRNVTSSSNPGSTRSRRGNNQSKTTSANNQSAKSSTVSRTPVGVSPTLEEIKSAKRREQKARVDEKTRSIGS